MIAVQNQGRAGRLLLHWRENAERGSDLLGFRCLDLSLKSVAHTVCLTRMHGKKIAGFPAIGSSRRHDSVKEARFVPPHLHPRRVNRFNLQDEPIVSHRYISQTSIRHSRSANVRPIYYRGYRVSLRRRQTRLPCPACYLIQRRRPQALSRLDLARSRAHPAGSV